ncbi:MAG: hypothetical protein M1365_07170 [Actinobacteria bacterium]|nr:hypothetical protein [Actinomycetota bacterium]
MNTKQKIEKYLNLEKVGESAASVHWWGNYRYEISGRKLTDKKKQKNMATLFSEREVL